MWTRRWSDTYWRVPASTRSAFMKFQRDSLLECSGFEARTLTGSGWTSYRNYKVLSHTNETKIVGQKRNGKRVGDHGQYITTKRWHNLQMEWRPQVIQDWHEHSTPTINITTFILYRERFPNPRSMTGNRFFYLFQFDSIYALERYEQLTLIPRTRKAKNVNMIMYTCCTVNFA